MTILPKGIRYKLLLAFSLMSLIPLLVCTYLVSLYIFPQLENILDISIIVALSIVMALLGLILAKRLVDPVAEMALEARIIADGEYDRKIHVKGEDEIGNLGESINTMTERIKSNIDELKIYGQKTREINLEIHKKVLALTSLLQIGDIITTGSMELERILDLSLEKALSMFEDSFGVLYMPKEGDGDLLVKFTRGIEKDGLEKIIITRDGKGPLEKTLMSRSILTIDSSVKASKELEAFKNANNVENMVAVPLYSGSSDLGLLILGNRMDDFRYRMDDIDMIKVFAEQMTIAIENEYLVKKNRELAIKDDLTDLYNKNYILTRLEEEIRRSIFCQRPCSFIVFNIDNYKKLRSENGELFAEEMLKKVARLLKDNVTPIGKTARVGGDEFAVLLPEKNKNEAINIAEDIRRAMEAAQFSKEKKVTLTVSAGVSENPIDGATKDELFKKAMEALKTAKSMGKNRVGV
jgi:diguanylate cyclase (GGDEF)-like protein